MNDRHRLGIFIRCRVSMRMHQRGVVSRTVLTLEGSVIGEGNGLPSVSFLLDPCRRQMIDASHFAANRPIESCGRIRQ